MRLAVPRVRATSWLRLSLPMFTPIGWSMAVPAGSSAVRLHHFSKHAEGGHGPFWHLCDMRAAK